MICYLNKETQNKHWELLAVCRIYDVIVLDWPVGRHLKGKRWVIWRSYFFKVSVINYNKNVVWALLWPHVDLAYVSPVHGILRSRATGVDSHFPSQDILSAQRFEPRSPSGRNWNSFHDLILPNAIFSSLELLFLPNPYIIWKKYTFYQV